MLCMVVSTVDTPEEKCKVELLYEQYNQLMYVVAYKILNHEQDAEDAVIEAWMKIIRHLDKINEISCQETKSFIVIVSERVAIDIYRKNRRRADRTIALDDYESSPYFATRNLGFEEVEIYNVMRSVPKLYSDVLILNYVNNLSIKEIADILNTTENTVAKRLSRGRAMLKEMMSNER